jgi:ZIP family zinc transporter
MPVSFESLPPIAQAALAATGTWLVTGLGALPVFWFRSAPRRLLDILMGFAGGVMTAAACWSLLIPALALGGIGPAAAGVGAGVALIYTLDQVLPHLHSEFPDEARPEGPPVAWRRSALLFAAITLHNFPEGLAVGVAYGGGATGAATALAIGIGLQNLPEGLAISLPLRRDGMPRWKAFWYGQLSAVIEPVAAVIGAAVVLEVRAVLPYALALAAGAMLYVVVEELIPETVRAGNADSASLGFMLGFVIMMVLDNAFV